MAISVSSISGTVLNVAVVILAIIFAGAIAIGLVYLWTRWKKYKEYKCIIWEKDGFGQVYEKYDQAGVFVDNKTNYKRMFLKKANVSLSADNIPFIQSGKFKVVYLHQYGLKNFRFIKPRIEDKVSFQVGEEDVNWAVVSYERGKKAFSMDRLLQFMPYIALGFVSLVILILFIYLIKQFDTLKEAMLIGKELTHNLAQAKAGTIIVD